MSLALSIIVPVYKVEPYLAKCVDSLLNQDLDPEKYDIILVDDGSPDNCPSIADSYAKRHQTVKVFHKTNGGLSSARNFGIRKTEAKYIQFVDSDDYLEPDVLGGLIKKMEDEQLDVLRFNYQNVDEHYQVFNPNHYDKPFVDYRDDVCTGLSFLNERLGYGCYACQFIVRRSLLEDCLFKEGIYFEDTEWTPRMLLKADRVTSTSKIVYNYLCRKGSITHSNGNSHHTKLIDNRFRLIDSIKSQMQSSGDKRWFEGMIAQTAITLISDICYLDSNMRRHHLRKLQHQDIFPLSTFHATRTARRKLLLANISPALLCSCMRLRLSMRTKRSLS